MEVKLVVQNGKQAGTQIPVKGDKLLIGRGQECNIRPQSSLVSRKHCLILLGEQSATVEDCGSTNGTFLNDRRITERCELHDDDRLRVGMLDFQVHLSGVAAAKGKPAKSKVYSVHEAAARTAGSSLSLQEDLDISGWLDEGGEADSSPTRRHEPVSGDTVGGKSLIDTSTLPAASPKQDEKGEEEKSTEDDAHPPKKPYGKLRRSTKPTAADSGAAADDALRKFFHRKKP